MYRIHTLPTTLTKDETTEDTGGRPTRSIEDSLVLVQALRQCKYLPSPQRRELTSSQLARRGSRPLSSNSRPSPEVQKDTKSGSLRTQSGFAVTYQPYQVPIQTPSPYYPSTGQRPPGWSATPYTYPSTPQTPSTSKTTAAQVYAPSTPAVVSSMKGAVPITNELISQVNTAAVSNPTLANLLGLAASGSATPEQLQTLGVTIQSLAENALKSTASSASAQTDTVTSTPPSKAATSTQKQVPVPPPKFQPSPLSQSPKTSSTTPQPPVLSLRPAQASSPSVSSGQSGSQTFPSQQSWQPPQMQTINKDPDVVIEFYENSYDRWILPKDLVLYERVKRWDGNGSLADIIFSTIFPFEGSKAPPVQASSLPTESTTEPQEAKDIVHPITLRFFNVPPAIWNLFSKAASDEERTQRVQVAMDAQLDNAATRVYLQHRITDGTLLTQLQTSVNDRYPTKPIRPTVTVTNTTHTKRRSQAGAKTKKEGSSAGAPPPKRKRTTPSKKPEPKIGKCEGCLRDSVSLVPNTSYCPTCHKAKKASATKADASSTTPKSTPATQRFDAQSATANGPNQSSVQPMQAAYTIPPSVQGYYTWQNQPQYFYQYQPQQKAQQYHNPVQPAPPSQASPSQPTAPQQPLTTPQQQASPGSIPKDGSTSTQPSSKADSTQKEDLPLESR